MSRQIKLLEDHIGTKLFERANREVRLTRAGAEYLEELTEAFARVNSASARFVKSHCDQKLRLSTSLTFTLRWLIPRLVKFHANYPSSQVQLTTSLKPLDFRTDDIDIGVRLGSGHYQNSSSCFLMSSDLVPVCSPALLNERPLKSLKDLASHTLLHSTARLKNWPTWLHGVSGAHDLEEDKGVYFESTSLALQAAIDGMGVAIGQVQLVLDDIAAGRLVAPLGNVVTEDDAFYVIYAEGAMRNKTLQRFRDWLVKEAGATPRKPGVSKNTANFHDGHYSAGRSS